MKRDDWDEDELDDDEDFAADDLDDTTEPCSNCGAEVYDDAEQCPKCGYYLTAEDERPSGKPWWVVLGAIVCLLLAVYWLFVF